FKLIADKPKTIRSGVKNRYTGQKIQTLEFCFPAGNSVNIGAGFNCGFIRLETLQWVPTRTNNGKSLILYGKARITIWTSLDINSIATGRGINSCLDGIELCQCIRIVTYCANCCIHVYTQTC